MKNLFLFFLLNIISVISVGSSIGTKKYTGIIIAYALWALFLNRVLSPKKRTYKR
jgi:UPF0716 family protein affecting phage T7 exclusion